jgi:hypothetical protein
LRINYKSFSYVNPGVPEQKRVWRPVLTVQIVHNHAKSKRFDAIVDTASDYCLFDPYALVFYGWGVRDEFPMKELSAYTAWQDRIMKRPTVRKTVDTEQNVSTS